jgi:ferric-dicitrate binding protein FerR (iron transport regulator)
MTLVDGSISILGEGKNEITTLKPSQTAVYSRSQKTIFISSDDTELYTSWRNGQFKFRRMHFEEISRRLSRNFNVDFVIKKENLKQVTFSGSFHNYESLDQILHAFQRNYPFHYKINKNQIIIE